MNPHLQHLPAIPPGLPKVPIFRVGISRFSFDAALQACERRISSQDAGQGPKGYVCFVNTHTLTESTRHAGLFQALNESFLSVADGVPLVWASRLKGIPIGSRVCGPDFMATLIRKHSDWCHGFIGGVPGQAEDISKRFCVPAVCYSPPMRAFSKENVKNDWEAFLKTCPEGRPPKLVWVGLGAPKQELWMNEAARLAPGTLFFGVGAAFDFLTQKKKRAPLWMQKNGLEWLYRLGQEPGRLWKRYLVNNSLFVLILASELVTPKSWPRKK